MANVVLSGWMTTYDSIMADVTRMLTALGPDNTRLTIAEPASEPQLRALSRDGLLPEFLSKVHPKFHTPHVVTMITGIGVAIAAAFFNVGALADISNTGTLFAFIMVAIGVLILRRTQPIRPRPFRTPIVWVICPLAVAGCLLLFVNLSAWTIKVFFGWAIVGGIVYLAYGKRHSNLGRLSAGGS